MAAEAPLPAAGFLAAAADFAGLAVEAPFDEAALAATLGGMTFALDLAAVFAGAALAADFRAGALLEPDLAAPEDLLALDLATNAPDWKVEFRQTNSWNSGPTATTGGSGVIRVLQFPNAPRIVANLFIVSKLRSGGNSASCRPAAIRACPFCSCRDQ
ncbi:MAG: hypothetical protein O7D96_01020 [SAR324 cluster bacterium]|nr:hypothetical protein [SAR324 cluster bacterium]